MYCILYAQWNDKALGQFFFFFVIIHFLGDSVHSLHRFSQFSANWITMKSSLGGFLVSLMHIQYYGIEHNSYYLAYLWHLPQGTNSTSRRSSKS